MNVFFIWIECYYCFGFKLGRGLGRDKKVIKGVGVRLKMFFWVELVVNVFYCELFMVCWMLG